MKSVLPGLGAAALLAVSCACGGAASPVASTQGGIALPALPSPSPAATPAPVVAPTPSPTPTPCTQGLCEEPTTNTKPPVRITLRIYTVVNGGEQVFGFTEETPIPVGYTVTVDATAKDEDSKDTLGQSAIQWDFLDAEGVTVVGNHTHQRRITGNRPGTVLVTATQDGVASNTLKLRFE